LVNHFYTGKDTIFSAPLKAVDIDNDGILRLKWWDQNNLLKDKKIRLSLAGEVNSAQMVKLFNEAFNTDDVGVVEANIKLGFEEHEISPAGFYFSINRDSGYVVLFNRKEAVFGTMNGNGTGLKISVKITRDIDFSEISLVSLVFKRDMMEAYLDDYLVMLKRINWTGKLGVVEKTNKFKDIRAWVRD
jgi:hypothetical protein